jgi:hypothetical protein
VVDRNRIVKYSSASLDGSGAAPQSKHQQRQNCLSSVHNLINQSAGVLTNVNLFYELMQAIPELSNMQIRLFFVYFFEKKIVNYLTTAS